MAYYDRIAKQWHTATGYKGGSFKRLVLNDVLLDRMTAVAGKAILELGAGNGYFLPLALDHFGGQTPARIVVTDQSTKLLATAETHFHLPNAEYLPLDVRSPFPIEDASFDLILATMVFNEVSTGGMRRALAECHRVLRSTGQFLISLTHPAFIDSLDRRGLLMRNARGILTMPGSGQLRLPIVARREQEYERLLTKTGFTWRTTDVYATAEVLSEKPGLRHLGDKPLGLVYECWHLDGR